MMSTKRDGLKTWWMQFEQMKQLSSLMGLSMQQLIDEYLSSQSYYIHAQKKLEFEEYAMFRACKQIPDLLRLCPRLFFELMDVSALMEGNTQLRSRSSFVRVAPLLQQLAGTAGVAGIVFDELVSDCESKEELTLDRFEKYVDALYKAEFDCNYADQWSVIKEQCGLESEQCILHTPYAADCSQFPPAVGSLYLSADHIVFQDPVLHNRRVISLQSVIDVRRVAVELNQARLLLSHLPGFGLLAKGGNLSIVAAVARLAGFKSGGGEGTDLTPLRKKPTRSNESSSNDLGNSSPVSCSSGLLKNEACSSSKREVMFGDSSSDNGMPSPGEEFAGETGYESSNADTDNDSGAHLAGEKQEAGGAGGQKGFMGLSAIQFRWHGGGLAKFQFVELSGLLCATWMKHLKELLIAHKMARERYERSDFPIPIHTVFESGRLPWLPAFVAENIIRARALESVLGREVSSLFLCSLNSSCLESNGVCPLIEELYSSFQAAERYRKAEEEGKTLDIFNFKTLDQNLVKLDELSLGIYDTLKSLDHLCSWRQPLLSSAALAACLAVFHYDALSMLIPGAFITFSGKVALRGCMRHLFPAISSGWRRTAVIEAASTTMKEQAVVASATGCSYSITRDNLQRLKGRGSEEEEEGTNFAEYKESSAEELISHRKQEEDFSLERMPSQMSGRNMGSPATRGWFSRIGDQVASVRKLRQNMKKALRENFVEVERQLQVGLQMGREKTQKLSQLQNTIQQVNRILAKLAILYSWEHPRQSMCFCVLVASTGTALAVTPARWIFLCLVIGKFVPGDMMQKRLKGLSLFLARKYLDPPETIN
mmetsp:Transcript_52239/g.162233  ORF Transcript_52239/g.162233 Transcript_52239/m.162233 type:complete len:825 (-) Transcript_52239:15-2489(-)